MTQDEKKQPEHSENESNSIFDSRSDLLTLHSNFEANAKFVIDKIWSNASFFTTITTALIALCVTLSSTKDSICLNGLSANIKSAILSIIPIMVIAISVIGIRNLKREYIRFLEWVTSIIKLQELIGLNDKCSFSKFKNDNYLLRVLESERNYSSSNEFIAHSIKQKDSLYYYFKILHIIYIALSVLLSGLFLWPLLKYFWSNLSILMS